MGLMNTVKRCSVGINAATGLSSIFSSNGSSFCLPSKFIRQTYATSHSHTTNVPPKEAQVVICGSGAVANSIAYHLVQSGWKDVVVLEQHSIGQGTSLFGSGTLGLFKPSAERNLISYSIKLYQSLQDHGYNIDLKRCGSLNLAQTKDRLIALKRRVAYSLPKGLQCEVVTPAEIRNLHPLLRTEGLEGGVWVPDDATASSSAVCLALADLARQGGANYIEGCRVEWVLTENSKVKGVQTNLGNMDCQYFVNCAGMWARQLGQQCSTKVKIPVNPAEHFYATTRAIPSITSSSQHGLPTIRDYDSHVYMREWIDPESKGIGLLVGGFENEAKPLIFNNFSDTWKEGLPPDWDHFGPMWEKAVHRMPCLAEAGRPQLINWPDNFTPDGRWILGETSEVGNYFVGVGLNGNALQGAGGVGRAIAEWIISGEPPRGDLLPFDVRRFTDLHNNAHYLRQRTKEVVGRHYSILYPLQTEFKYARKLRCSPLYSVLETRGAVFGVRMGFERALYFDTSYTRGDPLPQMPQGTFGKPKFFDYMREEYVACREGVGIIDMSSFAKFEIKSQLWQERQSAGHEVVSYLQHLCSNDVNIPVGGIAHTGMQNERGGYENDCMLVRQADNCYYMVSPTNQQTRILSWMRRHLPADNSVGLSDVTSMHTVLNVVGPKARELMSEMSNTDMHLMPFTYKKVNVGYASDVMVMAFTNTGEAGYSLYIPSEYALHVYDRLMKVGRDYGVRDVGYITLRFLRIEKFIPFWAEELDCVTTPYEVGRGYKVKLDKEEYFIGKHALQRQKETGVRRRLVLFTLDDFDADQEVWPWGGEPIYRDGQFVGSVTSVGYGFTVDKMVCLGFVRHPSSGKGSPPAPITADFINAKGVKYEVDIAGKRVLARPHLHPPLLYPSSSAHDSSKEYADGGLRYRPKVRGEAVVSARSIHTDCDILNELTS
ncbi:pyruvate dehydrogenase phosphatase regulatory subunit, mitochondrial-like isoform X1 [Hetaerina americana]|uniref:pyruvate dehydrogenase phosphatase regulatory subunit, mitochondrial-like isoform X1 n=1 Tax=Hetaerina americana TaxID=62018 RepID=UPI003A7F5CD1